MVAYPLPLCADIDALIQDELRESFHWLVIKEKYGMLSVSYAAPSALTEAIDALVNAADTACRQPSVPTTDILLCRVDSLKLVRSGSCSLAAG